MRVLIDPQIFHWQEYGGISRYVFELMRYLDGRPDVDINLPLYHSFNAYIAKAEFAPHLRLIGAPRRHTADAQWWSAITEGAREKLRERIAWRNRRKARQAIAAGDYDICHVTYFDTYFMDQIGDRPFVITIYDMISELFPDMFKDTGILRQKQVLVEKASRVIAISENTKQDLVQLCGIDPDKVDVVHLATSLGDSLDANAQRLSILPERYILYVGDRWNYKNFPRFVGAAAPILNRDRDLQILCAGSHPFNHQELASFDKLGIAGQVRHMRIHDADLAQAYHHALFFVFPSRYEGFGIPLLEAFNCGCPVAASNVSSLPEVAADAAEYFDPESEHSIYEALARLVDDEPRRRELIELGRLRARDFSWQRVGQESVDLYRKVIDSA